ncbi:MAG: diaminopimelate epimerase [Sulfurovum sp.]|nr:diaminopimelate epimerase [Sulfurovum sp.]MCB4758978.1 diaminopimelate epimerase [Sulfurovum sp.]MCB4773823.1 diaminopimelate epimerase [Sulfurovum sp.]MCB4781707.1 diaminopimelate epimerase [Sulfurovum sp.]
MTVTKYSASGNDFIILIAQEKEDRSDLAKKLCHRQNGVGADGMVVVLPHPEYDFEWEFYNADGSYATMCGNASRAVAHFAHEKGICKNDKAEFLTGAGVIRATINGLYVVSDMVKSNIIQTDIIEDGETWWLIDSGVPHMVTLRDDIEEFNLEKARQLRQKYNANINICKVVDNTLYIRTYERGVEDETLACGTGMVACFIRNYQESSVSDMVTVYPKSGDEIYVSYEEGVYRFGGKVIKTFIAETLI